MPYPKQGTPLVGSHAVLSQDGLYRYTLERQWTVGPLLPWVMLNPSTADATTDDATIRRVTGYTRREGCAGFYVVNLYAYRATEPKELLAVEDPVGPENDKWLQAVAEYARMWSMPVVCAWGVNAPPARVQFAREVFAGVQRMCLGICAGGAPAHPGRLRADAPLVPWP